MGESHELLCCKRLKTNWVMGGFHWLSSFWPSYAFTLHCVKIHFFPFQPNRIGSWSPTFASVWKRTGTWVDSIDYRYFDHRVPLLFIVRTQSPTPSNGKQSLSSFFFSDNFLSQSFFQSLGGISLAAVNLQTKYFE